MPKVETGTALCWPLVLALAACAGDIDEPDPLPAAPGAPGVAGAPATPGGAPGERRPDGTGGREPGAPPPAESPAIVPTPRLSRLSHRQWENTVRDLLRLPAPPRLASTFTGDPVRGRFDNNGGLLQVTSGLRVDYQRAAELLAERVTSDPAALARLLPPNLPTEPSARARAFIEGFGLRAYRRPLTAAEVNRFTALFARGPQLLGGRDPFADGVRVALEAFLQSPHFLYRTELTPAPAGQPVPLAPYEVAAKLSYTLAHTMPDSTLLSAAGSGALATRAAVRVQAERLLATAAAGELIEDFHAQLLRTHTYEAIEKEPRLFPEYVPGIGLDMQRETLLFARDLVLARGAGLRELLLSPHTFVNKRLAAIYKVPGTFGDGFQRVDLDPSQRAGLLTHVGFLASNAYRNEVDSIHRGVFVHLNILCTNLPPPVDDVALTKNVGRTNRERITANTGPGTCGDGCHSAVINPVGFAFEHYDALGRYRTTDNGAPVDASGSYFLGGEPRSWRNAIEFSRLVADSREAHECYARSWLEYLHGRLPEEADAPALTSLGERSRAGSVRSLVVDLVTSDAFLSRAP